MSAQVQAPWSAEQVAALNAWQASRRVHPFTCGGNRGDAAHTEYARTHGGDRGQLVAHPEGWRCPVCDYTQDWAHEFMTDGAALERQQAAWDGLLAARRAEAQEINADE